MTSPDLFRRIREAYDRVLDAPELERAGVIAVIAAGQPDVHIELMRLLAHHQSSGGVLQLPAVPSDSSDSWSVFPVASYRADLQALTAQDGPRADRGSAPPPPQIGPYELLDVLGEGGMGVVYRARDTRSGDEVALKMLQHVSPDALARFKRESRLVADIADDNIVKLYELLSDGRRWCLTMELVRGHTFLRHLATVAPGERLARLRELLGQLAHAMVTLHEAKVIHRDIKPSNVLVTFAGRLVLLDFGLAAALDERNLYRSTADHLVGTIPYLSPEHASGTAVSFASDWYSLGVMVYEALTGRHPFMGTAAAILTAKGTEDPIPPSAVAGDVPQDLAALCLELLRRDPARRPSGADVLRRLGAPAVPSRTGAVIAAESAFVGRQRELARLDDAYRATRNGTAVIVYLRGESGAGKSALLQRFVDQLRHAEPGVVTLIGRCYEHESVPFKALDSLVDAIARFLGELPQEQVVALLPRDVRALARLFPVLRQVQAVIDAPSVGSDSSDPQELRRRAAAALRQILERIGDRYPLVLAIDDLQWGDADSASVLTDILTPPDPPVFLGIGCCRTEDLAQSPFFAQLRQLRTGTAVLHDERDIVVGELVAEETRVLTRQLLASTSMASETTMEAIVRESRGRPLLVRELVEHVARGRDVAALDGTVTLDAALWNRIRQLPADARLLLELLAVAGRPMTSSVAAAALPTPVDNRAALTTLRERRFVRGPAGSDGDLIEAYHDQVRECVLGHMEPAVCRDHHRRLAQTFLRRANHDHEMLARHFHGSGDLETAATHYARAAAIAAEALAFDHAAHLYRRALELAAWPDPERRRLQAALGDALANAGRGAESAREFVGAADGAEPMLRLDLHRRAALQLLTSGHVDEGVARLTPMLRAFGLRVAGSPWRSLLWLLVRRARLRVRGLQFVERSEAAVPAQELLRIDASWSAVIGLSLIDPIRGADFQAQNLLLALEVGEPFRVVRALAVEAGHLGSSGAVARATAVLEQAERLARDMERPYANAIIELARATTAYFAQRWRDALAAARRAESIFRERCNGVAWEIDTASAFSLWSLAKLGELATLNRVCHPLLKEAIEHGDLYAATNLSTQIMTFVRIAADDPAGARRELESAISRWSQNGYHIQHHDALHALVPLELYCDRAPAAWERVEAEWAAFRWSLLNQIQDVRIEMLQLHAYCALAMAAVHRDNASYLASAARDARRLRRERLRWTDGHANYIAATIAARRGDDATAVAMLEAAVAAFDAVEANLYAAVTRRRLAALIGGSAGEALNRSAEQWFTAQGVVNPLRMTMAFAPGFSP